MSILGVGTYGTSFMLCISNKWWGGVKKAKKTCKVEGVKNIERKTKNIVKKMEAMRTKITRLTAGNDPVKNKLRLQKQAAGKRL